jgi:hypothetical protein
MADPNASAFAVLEDKIAQYRVKLADVPDDVVEDVADIINEEQRRTISAKVDAYGNAWTDKKVADGAFRFVAPTDVVTGAIGRTIVTRIKSRVAVLHHLGYARGNVTRRVIPYNGKIPPRWSARIRERVLRAFKEATA